MKIARVKIKNFRSYKDEIAIDFDDLTAFVGKNDIGKSTILEALDIFFNDGSGAVKIDDKDINIYAAEDGDNETTIAVCFSELPDSIIIDDTVSTTLDSEYMLNSEGMLEVVKKYRKGSRPSIFIRANHPRHPKCCDLLLKKNSGLKTIVKNEGIECGNQTINSEMRHAIWNHFADRLDLGEIDIDASREDAKMIWEKLSVYMPVYSLFRADRENSDKDDEVQDPLKEAVKQIINDESLQSELSRIAEKVLARLQEVSDRTLEKLHEMDAAVADTLRPDIPEPSKLKWTDVFKGVSISGDENIPVSKRGSGVKRLILLSFFRAEAERKAEDGSSNGIIYAIEEPETSQHPRNQIALLNALKSLAGKEGVQVIITTHSPFVVKELEFENIRLLWEDGSGKHISKAEAPVLRYRSLNEVIYIAFGEATEYYHDELYGWLVARKCLGDYEKGKRTKPYIDDRNPDKEKHYTLTRRIRHQIHHPENGLNEPFTIEQLKQSIDDMRIYIQNHQDLVILEED